MGPLGSQDPRPDPAPESGWVPILFRSSFTLSGCSSTNNDVVCYYHCGKKTCKREVKYVSVLLVFVFTLCLGLFRSTALLIGSDYIRVYSGRVWLSLGAHRVGYLYFNRIHLFMLGLGWLLKALFALGQRFGPMKTNKPQLNNADKVVTHSILKCLY